MPKSAMPIFLSDDDKSYLKSILQKGTVEARNHRRARILLLKSEGMADEAIADKLDISRPTVKLCLKKYMELGVKTALEDSKGRGRKIEITDDAKTWVINIACQKPSAFGLPEELWYPLSLTRYINSVAEQEGYSRMATASDFSIRKILRKAMLNPHKVTYYCEKRDPDFEKKMHDVLFIYKQVELRFDEDGSLITFVDDEEPVHTLSYDEKHGIQAIVATSEDRPPVANTEKMSRVLLDYAYKRLGTLFLLAAIDLLTGEVIPLLGNTYKSSTFVTFLKKLDEKYPKGDKIRLILDNHPFYASSEAQEYLNTVPERIGFVFTPTHGSWLNMIEGFFSKITRQMLSGIRAGSKEELKERILRYFEEINEVSVPYKWKYRLDTIDLSEEDVGTIVYEVVNVKAAGPERERAPKPKIRKSKNQTIINT